MGSAATFVVADAWGMHGNAGAGWWILMVLLMVGFLGTLIVGGAYLLRRDAGERDESPMAILDRRFAEGEISVEEYRERRKILANGTVTQNGGDKDEALTAPGRKEGRQ